MKQIPTHPWKVIPLLLLVCMLFLSMQPSNKLAEEEIRKEKVEAFKMMMMQSGECEWDGIKLYGKVEFVDHFPDIKIEYVEHFPDIKVKMVDHFADECGEWEKVDHFPDFKVQVVEHFPDLKVELVDYFPGMN